MKAIKVKITYPSFSEDIHEVVEIHVPDNLTEAEEDKYIEDKLEEFEFLYGY